VPAVTALPSSPPETPLPNFAAMVEAIVDNVAQVIQGKRDAIELALISLLSEGHLLVEDVPGVGKTSLARALALSIDCSWRRVQFTPDLLPTDLVGVTVWRKGTETFEFQRGPVFANLLLADEINRASPKTQSALLESMEERQVTVDGRTYALPRPFLVIATQNPVEQEGTYNLPESQLDRFLLRISIGYPDRLSELAILEPGSGSQMLDRIGPVVTGDDVLAMAAAASRVHLAQPLREYLVDISTASRRHPGLALGLSPRATVQLARATRTFAAARGRDYAIPDDVKALAVPVLAHRLSLRHDAVARGLTAEGAVGEVLASVPVPKGR
jgi:MoxR-like ATPase